MAKIIAPRFSSASGFWPHSSAWALRCCICLWRGSSGAAPRRVADMVRDIYLGIEICFLVLAFHGLYFRVPDADAEKA